MKKILKDISAYYKQNEKEFGRGIFLIIIAYLISIIFKIPIVDFLLNIIGFFSQSLLDFYYRIVGGSDSNTEVIGYSYNITSFLILILLYILPTRSIFDIFLKLLFMLTWIIVFAIALLKINTGLNRYTFEKQLLRLTPHISHEKITELKINWTYIKSEADYDSLNSKIEKYFKEYNIPER